MCNLLFEPTLNPRDVIEKGAFGGSYFGLDLIKDKQNRYKSLFEYHFTGLETNLYLSETYKPRVNKFKIRSGMPYEYWKEKKWISERDPYGWFEWWCKYEMGLRDEKEDIRQISRWQDFCGFNGRWRRRIYKRIDETGDWNISPRIQQSLLHWGYEVNRTDYQVWKEHCK